MKKPSGYWTKERCAEEASKYHSRLTFKSVAKSAYDASVKNGWLNEIMKDRR